LRISVSESQFPSLQTIELGRTGWTRWAGSLAAHAAFVALVIAVPWAMHEEAQTSSERVVSLTDPVLPKPIPLKPAVKPVVVRRIPPPVATPVVVTPAIVKPAIVKPAVTFQAPKPQAIPAPKVEVESSLPAPAPAPVQQIALAKIEVAKPAPPVKVGGFGDPNGVQPSPNSSPGKLIAATTGAFDLSEGSSHGKGSPGNRGGVIIAGFGDGAAGAGSGRGGNGGRGAVRSAGFGEYDTAPTVSRSGAPAAPVQPVETPVEITFKPKPAYTAEAREKKIEGEVLLEVIFGATGQIHVERVMRGLGFGLDERARDAAAQIRFQPGTRAGNPVDMKGIVHIVFALS
jgi:TonB family protein